MNLGQIVLFSDYQQELSRFISSLFDLDASVDDEGIKIDQGKFTFKICSKRDFSGTGGNSTILDFHVESMDELHDYMKKIQFYCYRTDQVNQDDSASRTRINEDSLIIEQNGNVFYFMYEDFDGRLWRFSYVNLV